MKRLVLIAIWVACVSSGCSLLQNDDKDVASKLPKPKAAPDSVGIELTFVRIPLKEDQVEQSIWAEADEQCVEANVRRHLERNGFRCGLVNQQLPTKLRELLDESHRSGNQSADNVDLSTRTRRQTWHASKRVLIMATPSINNFICLQSNADEKQISGKAFNSGQGFFAARAFPLDDGHVRFQLVPEVHHGEIKNQYVASEGSIQIQAGREKYVIDDMTLESILAPGQTLLLSCTSDHKGLGRTFFVDDQNGEPHQKMLLLRLIQTQKADLFDSLFDE